MAAPNSFYDVANDDTHWSSPNADYAAITTAYGGASAADRNAAKQGVLNTAVHTPTGLAIVAHGDAEHIYVVHSPTLFPTDATNTTNYDGNVVTFLGNILTEVTPLVLPNEAFHRIN